MKDKKYHAEYWQGKRKDQYKSSAKIFGWSFILGLAIIVIYVITEIFKNL